MIQVGSLAGLVRTKPYKSRVSFMNLIVRVPFSKLPNHLFVPLDEDVMHSGWALWKIKWTCKDLARISTILSTVDHYLPASRTEMLAKIDENSNVVNRVETTPYSIFRKWPFWVWKTIHIFLRTDPSDSPIQRPCIQHVLHIHCIFVWLYHHSHS